ncbi:MAG TPA: hypothetical protein VM580_26940, partial [Labilithrix sp.]|nr:hypothetical protein [Labilithrix sp.]
MDGSRLSRFGSIVLAVAAVGACSASAQRPPVIHASGGSQNAMPATPDDLSPNVLRDRRAAPGVRAPATPLVFGKASSVKCGKFAKAPDGAEMSELLAGRLLVRPPLGAKVPAPQPDAP